MISTVLPSEPLLSHGNINPLYGGFTPWENLEYFFNPMEIFDEPKPNISYLHADLAVGSDISNQKLCHHAEPNLGNYNVISDLDLLSQNENITSFDQSNLSRYHVGANLASENPKPQPSPFCENNTSSNDQDQPNQNSPMSSSGSGGSDDPNPNLIGSCLNSSGDDVVQGEMEERKRKRMMSNRESARRSRMRKQKHVENLRNDVNGLKIQTREKSNQLRLMSHQINFVRRENDRLKAESIYLQRKLMELSQIWQLQQQCSYHH